MKDVLYEVRCLKSNEDMILALTGQFKQLSHEPEMIISSFDFKHRTSYLHLISNTALHITHLSYYIPFTGKHEPNKLTSSQLRDFIAQLVGELHRHRRGHGYESR